MLESAAKYPQAVVVPRRNLQNNKNRSCQRIHLEQIEGTVARS